MGMNSQKVGNQITVLRKAKELTQNELGERLNISFQAVSKWERGESLPDVAILLDLAKILQTTVDNILTGLLLICEKVLPAFAKWATYLEKTISFIGMLLKV